MSARLVAFPSSLDSSIPFFPLKGLVVWRFLCLAAWPGRLRARCGRTLVSARLTWTPILFAPMGARLRRTTVGCSPSFFSSFVLSSYPFPSTSPGPRKVQGGAAAPLPCHFGPLVTLCLETGTSRSSVRHGLALSLFFLFFVPTPFPSIFPGPLKVQCGAAVFLPCHSGPAWSTSVCVWTLDTSALVMGASRSLLLQASVLDARHLLARGEHILVSTSVCVGRSASSRVYYWLTLPFGKRSRWALSIWYLAGWRTSPAKVTIGL